MRKAASLEAGVLIEDQLQWGRTLSSAERTLPRPHYPIGCGKLQWGRTLSSAEREAASHLHVRLEARFNGAALFQVRKASKAYPPQAQVQQGFNGAALFQVRKVLGASSDAHGFGPLQWGRTLSSAERAEASLLRDPRYIASMGPHSFKCGKSDSECRVGQDYQGFNGAALFQVRKGQRR